ncbi:MAG: hypothetical protein JW915_07395 [Chitinispirillaceae bacterium]|nr:hypothetical protein [Chitinispirillaceae bacterium]
MERKCKATICISVEIIFLQKESGTSPQYWYSDEYSDTFFVFSGFNKEDTEAIPETSESPEAILRGSFTRSEVCRELRLNEAQAIIINNKTV